MLGLIISHLDNPFDVSRFLQSCKSLLALKKDHHLCAKWLARNRPVQAMILAIESNQPAIALHLLKLPCPRHALTAIDNYGDSVLHLAAAAKQGSVVVELLRHPECQSMVNTRNRNQETPLMVAAENGFLDIVQALTQQQGIDLDAQGKCGQHHWTALHRACRFGHAAVVRALCQSGCNVNSPAHNNSWRPLMWACHSGHVECVLALLNHPDINVMAVNANGKTVLDVMPQYNDREIKRMLVEHVSQ
ncbi:ankyrin repeat-containing domain protein [Dunaliella salina]|uniref:Ankyrin repeat-containing domain protein n=1 Tax=Dunaliella salina TaxID=3046 RepID=A0ABQ7GRU4_DUNSA|nr:ankyrin repeat-containing domain protein [Dunaliella salina]|eukprot:KAF5837302.1 ankyrin repeat-containing domain protein [Dunaliella salina]